MNTELNDKLDLIIAWAARDCENDEAEKFKNIDTSGVVLSAGFYARKRRLIGRYKLRPALAVCRKCFVRVAVALMALMSIGFLTVMAIPNVRNAMFDAVVEWYEDYVSVRFEPSGAQEPDGTSDIDPDTTVASVTPPTKNRKDNEADIRPARRGGGYRSKQYVRCDNRLLFRGQYDPVVYPDTF